MRMYGCMEFARWSLLAAVSTAAISLTPASVRADDDDHKKHFYVSAFAGWSKVSDDRFFDFVSNSSGARFGYTIGHDNGNTYGGAAGVIVSKNVRAEIEVAHSSFDYSQKYFGRTVGFVGQNVSGGVEATTVMGNVWVNANIWHLMPYVGGGVGVAKLEGRLAITNGAGEQFSGDDTVFVGQVGAGVRVPIGHHVELDFGYRTKFFAEHSFASSISGFSTTADDMRTHSLQVGAVVKF